MTTREKTLQALSSHASAGIRLAAAPEEVLQVGKNLSNDLQHNAGQTNVKRVIPADYKYDPSALKPMAKMLWSMSVSLGHALAAHRAFVRLKSATISPDGLLGGRGYVMAVKDVRNVLHDACEALSALCDTVHDEINAPHWQPKLGQLEKADVDRIRDLLSQAQGYLDEPEDVEEDEEEPEYGHAEWHHPAVQRDNKWKQEPRSRMPDGGNAETGPRPEPVDPNARQRKEASVAFPAVSNEIQELYASLGANAPLVEKLFLRHLQADSSLPVDTMPGGPRVEHLDRGDVDQTGPFGSYNRDEPQSMHDQWSRDDGVGDGYLYPSDWENDLHEKMSAFDPYRWTIFAESALPDFNSDPTPTQGWDWGIGYGNGNDAHGQGAGGYGEGNPGAPDTNPGGGTGNMGVYGPQSGLPKDPGGKVHPDDSDSTLTIENEAAGKGRFASKPVFSFVEPKISYSYAPVGMFLEPVENYDAGAELPGDNQQGVARSDYYDGWKPENMQNNAPSTVGHTKLPGEQMPAKATPTLPRPQNNGVFMFATGGLPGDGMTAPETYQRDAIPDGSSTYEDVNTPYVRWDYTTPEMRPDSLYPQIPIQGPYVHNDLAEPLPHG